MAELGAKAIGTWSGGAYLRFGEALDGERLESLLRPGAGIDTLLSADTYGSGAADEMLGRALAGADRDSYSLVGAVGHDFYEGERQGPRGFPRFTDPALRGPGEYAGYLRMAAERSLERLGVSSFDLLLLHNPDRIGYTSEAVWDAMAGLRADGLAGRIGIAPGPANGFTLDLIDCFERFGDRIDWAMVILNPFEPWPGELCLDAAAAADISVITRVVDYGGLFWGDLGVDTPMHEHDHRRFRPEDWIERGLARLVELDPIAAATELSPMALACAWNLSHPAVECVVPTLIQEIGEGARPIEDKRAELAAIDGGFRLDAADVVRIREVGDNLGSMALKGATPDHEGEERADRWLPDRQLLAVAERHGINPERELVKSAAD